MEHLSTIKALHLLAALLTLGIALGLAVWVWRAPAAAPAPALRRPQWWAGLGMGLCLLSLPVSGWWLVHLIGWPLGQTWLLASSVLYGLALVAIVWLALRLRRVQARRSRLTLALAVFGGACLLGIAALMGIKPL